MTKKPNKFDDITYDNCMDYVKNEHNCMVILTGERSKIVVIDIDDKDDGKHINGYVYWKGLIEEHEDIKTWNAKSANGGLHYYFKYDDKIKKLKTKSNITIGDYKYTIDIRNEKGLIYAPPTIYKSLTGQMREYIWIHSPFNTELASMPDWLYETLSHENNFDNKNNIKEKKVKLLLKRTIA